MQKIKAMLQKSYALWGRGGGGLGLGGGGGAGGRENSISGQQTIFCVCMVCIKVSSCCYKPRLGPIRGVKLPVIPGYSQISRNGGGSYPTPALHLLATLPWM